MTYTMIAWFKKYIALVVLGGLTFLSPLEGSLLFVGMISMADFITGIIKAKKTGTITSRKMINKAYAAAGYFVAILLSHGVEIYFGDVIPVVKAVVAIIALTEIQSVRENIKEITGTDVLSPLTKMLQRKTEEEPEKKNETV
jgi:phage-related holin